jgi:tyrosine-protein kinase Etk/Wzc
MNDMQLNVAPDVRELENTGPDSGGLLVNLVDLLVTLGQQKRLILKTTIVVAVLGVGTNFLLPAAYTGKTVLMPPQGQGSGIGALAGLSALSDLGGALGMKTPDEMYVGLLKSDTVGDDLVKRFDLRSRYKKKLLTDARERLAANVNISSDKKTGFITVEAKDKSPEFAATLANAYVDELRSALDRIAVTDAQQRRLFFQQQIDKTLTKLSAAESTFEQAQKKSGVVSLDGQVTSTIRESAELRAKIAASEVQLQAMRTYAAEGNPDVLRMLAEIKAMRDQLAGMEQGSGDGNASAQGNAAALANIRAYREVKYQEAILDQFRKQLELAQVDEAKEGPLVQQVDVAVPSERRDGLKRSVVAVLAVFVGLVLGVGLALCRAQAASNPQLGDTLRRVREAWRVRKS